MNNAAELHAAGWRALTKELGPADALRYRILFETGKGEYWRERDVLFADTSLETWIKDLREWEARPPRT